MPHQVKFSCALLGVGILFYLSTLLFMIASIESGEARYLPTRADETDVEVLKDLIKELMHESALSDYDSSINSLLQQGKDRNPYHHLLGRQLQLERRALEQPVSSLGDNRQRRSVSINDGP